MAKKAIDEICKRKRTVTKDLTRQKKKADAEYAGNYCRGR